MNAPPPDLNHITAVRSGPRRDRRVRPSEARVRLAGLVLHALPATGHHEDRGHRRGRGRRSRRRPDVTVHDAGLRHRRDRGRRRHQSRETQADDGESPCSSGQHHPVGLAHSMLQSSPRGIVFRFAAERCWWIHLEPRK